MFSLEKNYIKEQDEIIKRLKVELEEKSKETLGCGREIEELKEQVAMLREELMEQAREGIVGKEGLGGMEGEGGEEGVSGYEHGFLAEEDMLNNVREGLELGAESRAEARAEARAESGIEAEMEARGNLDTEVSGSKTKEEAEGIEEGIVRDKVSQIYIPERIYNILEEGGVEGYYEGVNKALIVYKLNLKGLYMEGLSEAGRIKLWTKLINGLGKVIYGVGGYISHAGDELIEGVIGLIGSSEGGEGSDKFFSKPILELKEGVEEKVLQINKYLKSKGLEKLEVSLNLDYGRMLFGGGRGGHGLVLMGESHKILRELTCLGLKGYSLVCTDRLYEKLKGVFEFVELQEKLNMGIRLYGIKS